MITKDEKRFLEQWREQKSGPKWKYYLLFSLGWTVVSFLFIFFLAKLFTNLWETGGAGLIYVFIVLAIIIGVSSTHITFMHNEKRYKRILNKEKGQLN